MNVERLQQLKRVLLQVQAEKRSFDMGRWVAADEGEAIPLLTVPAEECGTASCAAGWAARDPWFRRRGLTLKWTPAMWWESDFQPSYRGAVNLSALSAFFAISRDDAENLFAPEYYPGRQSAIKPRHVIKRIDEMLARAKIAA